MNEHIQTKHNMTESVHLLKIGKYIKIKLGLSQELKVDLN